MGKINVSGGLCLALAFMLLVFPLQWVLAAMLAAAFHELCHWCAIVLVSREQVPVGLFAMGARMTLPPMSRRCELLCALAGPVGGLMLLLFARFLPRTAVCAAFQSAYNLLPVYPFDGGRALESLLSLLLPPPKAQRVCAVVEGGCIAWLLALGGYAWLGLHLGLLPLLLAAFTVYRIKFSKTPCKTDAFRVQ